MSCCRPTSPNPQTCLTNSDGGGGADVPPPSDDDRCADPAFAEANPGLCRGYPRLLLKPSSAIVETGGTQQYRTFLVVYDQETELTAGLAYTITDTNVAIINLTTGLATGVLPGNATIAVTWQNLTAYASIEVVGSCDDVSQSYVLLIDDSKSMSQAFSSTYASKLSFAKSLANDFIDTVNMDKDKVAVVRFGDAGTILQALTQDKDIAKAAVNSIVSTTEKTNILDGLKQAVVAITEGNKVIILISDGENNGSDPLTYATQIKDAGGVIVVVATRAWDGYFDLLERIASPGFSLSAYGATEDDVIDTVIGLKTFLCSGDCQPPAGTYPRACLNYNGFTNWDVTGYVDLVGLGLWDVLPGHGLYVDLAGTGGAKNCTQKQIDDGTCTVCQDAPLHLPEGALTSKTAFTFVAGKNYRFTIKVAGNNVGSESINPVRVQIGALLDQTITPDSPTMPFTEYVFNFAGANVNAKIVIAMTEQNGSNVGTLIDDIVLENITNSIVMLNDNFNNENLVTISTQYYSSYGCLVSPPGAQSADPTPPTPSVIE